MQTKDPFESPSHDFAGRDNNTFKNDVMGMQPSNQNYGGSNQQFDAQIERDAVSTLTSALEDRERQIAQIKGMLQVRPCKIFLYPEKTAIFFWF